MTRVAVTRRLHGYNSVGLFLFYPVCGRKRMRQVTSLRCCRPLPPMIFMASNTCCLCILMKLSVASTRCICLRFGFICDLVLCLARLRTATSFGGYGIPGRYAGLHVQRALSVGSAERLARAQNDQRAGFKCAFPAVFLARVYRRCVRRRAKPH